jgi:hypothetical protein
MAARAALTALLAAVVVLAGGCGGSAASATAGAGGTASTGNTSTTGTSSTTGAPSTTGASSTTGAAAIPPGFARYRDEDFTFVAPRGFKPAPDGAISGLPRGASAEILTPGGQRVERTNTQIIEGFNPRLRTNVSLDEVALSLETADHSDKSERQVHTNVSTMIVSGAEDVRTVTESYNGPVGDGTRTRFDRTWLMVLARPGLLLDLVVVDEPQRGGKLDPATVLDSFRLDRPGG